MAYNNGYGSGPRGGSQNRGNGGWQGGASQQKQPPPEVRPMPVPEDYVDAAEQVMRELSNSITTSKIRNLLSMVSDVYDEEKLRTGEATLKPESISKLMMMRVRVVYEAKREPSGRETNVGRFVERTRILEYLKGIGSDREMMLRFAHYMEALVAYHRYFGGKEG